MTDDVRKPGERITNQELEAVVARGRMVPRAPDILRARLLARARASVAALEAPAPVAVPVASSGSRRLRFALAACLVSALVSAGAVAALHAWSKHAAVPPRDPPAAPAPPIRPTAQPVALAPEPTANATTRRAPRAHAVSPQESYAAELRLLRRAQSDYAGHDFSGALGLVAEHARSFPNGRLAEEREALRVRSLAGAGRTREARLAFATFARRFPRSVLLSRLQQTAPAAEE